MTNDTATRTTQAQIDDMREQLAALDNREQALERLIADAWGTSDQAALENELVTLPTRRRAAEIVLARLEDQLTNEERAAIQEGMRRAIAEQLAYEAERDKAAVKVEKAEAQLKRAIQAHQDALRAVDRQKFTIRQLQDRLKQTGLSPDEADRLTKETVTSARKR